MLCMGCGALPPNGIRVHGNDGSARAASRLDDDLPGHAQPEHRDRITDADLRVVDTVQRDSSDVREYADPRVSAFRQ